MGRHGGPTRPYLQKNSKPVPHYTAGEGAILCQIDHAVRVAVGRGLQTHYVCRNPLADDLQMDNLCGLYLQILILKSSKTAGF